MCAGREKPPLLLTASGGALGHDRRIANTEVPMPILASCHCGGTVIELPEPPTQATQCTCTYCTKTGGLWSYYAPEGPRLLKAEHLACYAPNTYNEHYFCARCGITTHGVSPAWELGGEGIPETKKFAVNARLLDDYALFTALEIERIDGRTLW